MLLWLRSSGLSQVGVWSSTIRFSPFSDRACFSLSTGRRCFRLLPPDRLAVVPTASVASVVTRSLTLRSSGLVASRCRVVENYLLSPLSDFPVFALFAVSEPTVCPLLGAVPLGSCPVRVGCFGGPEATGTEYERLCHEPGLDRRKPAFSCSPTAPAFCSSRCLRADGVSSL